MTTAGSEPAPQPRAGQALGPLIEEQLASEDARKASLEARGVTLITSSGAFVTVLGAVATLALGKDSAVAVPQLSAVFLTLGLVALFIAAICGVYVNVPQNYGSARAAHLLTLAQTSWDATFDSASQQIAISRAEDLVSARGRNKHKAWVLLVGAAAQVGALLLIGIAVASLVSSSA